MALDYSREYDPDRLIRDTRPFGDKAADFLKKPEFAFGLSSVLAGAGFVFPSLVEPFALSAIALSMYSRSLINKSGLALRVPKSSGLIDINDRSLKDGSPLKADGIIYVGNEQETNEEIWITDSMARTHMLFMGTTGSGKTEFLLSLVNNALIHASGFIYVDGKADSSLYAKIYSMARLYGREDSVLVVNFQTGAKDVFGPQEIKMSNTLNPFAVGSSGMLSQLVVSLMSTGKGDVWENRAISFVEALMKPLVFLRDNYGLMLDVGVIREYFTLPKLEELTWVSPETYPGLDGTLDGMKSYLANLPTYDRAKYQQQGETCNEQHGYITMQLVRTFNSLADTYGYIMRTQLAEIDFLDVFLNRRILVVLLPALEKSPPELTNLGRIIVAAIKATMAVGLGAKLEGDWDRIIESKPTTSPSPFMCVLDEYGYYAVEGFAVVPAQARSLGFAAIFAGQDLPAFQKASEKEAESTLANTNTKFCGKMSCVKTYKYFSDLAGQGYFTRTGGYVGEETSVLGGRAYRDGDNASIEKFERVTLDVLQKQKSGQWHLFFEGKIIRMKSFYADYSKAGGRNVQAVRVNHFLKVRRPDMHEVALHRKTRDTFANVIASERGFSGVIDTFPDRDIAMLSDFLECASSLTPGRSRLEQVIGALASAQQSDGVHEDAMGGLVAAYNSDDGSSMGFDAGDDPSGSFDFTTDGSTSQPNAVDFVSSLAVGHGRTSDMGQASSSGLLGPEAADSPRWDDFSEQDMLDADVGDEGDVDPSFLSDAEVFEGPSDSKTVRTEWPIDSAVDELLDHGIFAPTDDVVAIESATVAGFMPEFKTGDVDDGALNKDATQQALMDIQRRLGDSSDEASLAASVTVRAMAEATYYAQHPPVTPTSPEDFILIAQRVSSALAALDEKVRDDAQR